MSSRRAPPPSWYLAAAASRELHYRLPDALRRVDALSRGLAQP
jgi:hypothetical protein